MPPPRNSCSWSRALSMSLRSVGSTLGEFTSHRQWRQKFEALWPTQAQALQGLVCSQDLQPRLCLRGSSVTTAQGALALVPQLSQVCEDPGIGCSPDCLAGLETGV